MNNNSYLLQPGLQTLTDNAVPPTCADSFFEYPAPTNLNVNNRAYQNTMIIGTAPFMALKGPPPEYIMVSDTLRPQSTTHFNTYSEKPYDFPTLDVSCASVPVRTKKWNPVDTRSQFQNAMFTKRYCRQ